MEKQLLEYRLLHPSDPVDEKTRADIELSVRKIFIIMDLAGQQGKPKIVVDNRAISMGIPEGGVTAAGYVPGNNGLYLDSPTGGSQYIPLKKPLEEMTQEELNAFDEPKFYGIISPQLLVVLRDYVLEQPE